jgi:hypothetical protein
MSGKDAEQAARRLATCVWSSGMGAAWRRRTVPVIEPAAVGAVMLVLEFAAVFSCSLPGRQAIGGKATTALRCE